MNISHGSVRRDVELWRSKLQEFSNLIVSRPQMIDRPMFIDRPLERN